MNKKSKIIKENIFILIFSIFYLLLPPQKSYSQEVTPVEKQNSSAVPSMGINKHKEEYGKLIRLYIEYSQIEKDVFKNLTFKLAHEQLLRKGGNLKLTLEDNLGEKWIFKLSGGKKSETVYYLYKLFGLKTPEAHNISFILNGKKVEGSIQRYVFSQTEWEKLSFQKLSSESLNYLLKSHVIDWLIKNMDNHKLNYLALSLDETGNVKDLIRIDNDSAFTDKCDLDYDCMLCLSNQNSPYKTTKNWSYFYRLCESYKSKNINLPLEENYAFIKFVAGFPEDFFIRLILPTKNSSFNELIDSNFDRKKVQFEFFLNPIISRKNNILNDFKKFYSSLASFRNENLKFSDNNHDELKIITQISQDLAKQINVQKKERSEINASPLKATEIEAVVSPEGFTILKNIYLLYWSSGGKNLTKKCQAAINKLVQLNSAAIKINEKLALGYYIREIKKIRAGQNASFKLGEINMVVNDILPQE
ncbi:MAG: hypothetical protein V1670_03250 [Candidatus Omnitrophota bacterium]